MTGPKTFPPGTKIGLTTTIPVEVLLAAGLAPVDLNNIFITAPVALQLVSEAEAAGLPRTICAWVKGIYATLQRLPDIQAVLVACQGDCSDTQALGEILEAEGRDVIHFKFPYPRDREVLKREIAALREHLGVSSAEVSTGADAPDLHPGKFAASRPPHLGNGAGLRPGKFPVADFQFGFRIRRANLC